MSITTTLQRLGVTPPTSIAHLNEIKAALAAEGQGDDGTATFVASIYGNTWSPAEAVKQLRALADNRTRSAAQLAIVRESVAVFERAEAMAVRAAGDSIVASLRPLFDEAVAKLSEAVAITGPSPDPKSMSSTGPAALAAWSKFQEAVRLLGDIRTARVELADAAGYGNARHGIAAYIDGSSITSKAAADKALAVENGHGDRFARWLTHGLVLRLNTATEADAAAAKLASFAQSPRPLSIDDQISNRRADAELAAIDRQRGPLG